MKALFLAFAALALTLALDTAIALECYACNYAKGLDDIDEATGFDKSCQSGKKPKDKYNGKCGPNQDSCVKVVVEEGDMKGTIRSCWVKGFSEKIGLESEKCVEANSTQLSALIARLSIPGSLNITIPAHIKGTFCTCSEDKCNSSSVLKVTQGSLVVLVIGFLASKFTY